MSQISVTEVSNVMLIRASGALSKEDLAYLEELKEKIGASEAKIFLFSFETLDNLDYRALRPLAQLQTAIRAKKASVKISLNSKLKENLLEKGAIRPEEIIKCSKTFILELANGL